MRHTSKLSRPTASSLSGPISGMLTSAIPLMLIAIPSTAYAQTAENTATVTAPAGTLEVSTTNNSATDSDAVFETLLAVDDSISNVNGVSGAAAVLNAFTGDQVGSAAASTSNATLTVDASSSVPNELTFDPVTGDVGVAANTPAGTYSFDYQICETANPTNCTTANISVTVAPSVDLVLTKTNTPGVNGNVDQGNDNVLAGSTTSYTITVTNNGPDAAVGATVLDTPGASLSCPAGNAITFGGDGIPAGSFTVADLTTGSGIVLGTLNNGQSTTLTYTCDVVSAP